jgi:hypothetical protein
VIIFGFHRGMNSLIPKYREAPGLRSGNANGDEDEET